MVNTYPFQTVNPTYRNLNLGLDQTEYWWYISCTVADMDVLQDVCVYAVVCLL